MIRSYLNRNTISLAIPVTIGTGRDDAFAQGGVNALHFHLTLLRHPIERITVDPSWARMSSLQERIGVPFKTTMMVDIVYRENVNFFALGVVINTAMDIVDGWEAYENFPPHTSKPTESERDLNVDEMLRLILN